MKRQSHRIMLQFELRSRVHLRDLLVDNQLTASLASSRMPATELASNKFLALSYDDRLKEFDSDESMPAPLGYETHYSFEQIIAQMHH